MSMIVCVLCAMRQCVMYAVTYEMVVSVQVTLTVPCAMIAHANYPIIRYSSVITTGIEMQRRRELRDALYRNADLGSINYCRIVFELPKPSSCVLVCT